MLESIPLTKTKMVDEGREARRIVLVGEVQGVGLRPAIVQLASQCALHGWVRNVSSHVEVVIEGLPQGLTKFVDKLENVGILPGQASIVEVCLVEVQNYEGFRILGSDGSVSGPTGDVPFDRVTCADCRLEFGDPQNRRQGYGLIGCSSCGPRFSVLKEMPFDRETTALAAFDCCPACLQEYENASDRRYHSQTNTCPACGPQVSGFNEGVAALKRQEVVALRGIGGYQWIAAAHCEAAIQHLRILKQRPRKPFAVMLSQVQIEKWILEKEFIERIARPDGSILILPVSVLHQELLQRLAPSVRMDVQSLGVMLPTSMLHAELVAEVGPLVITSANLEGEPMSLAKPEIGARGIGEDGQTMQVIDHNRPIWNRVDDSVVKAMGKRFTTIRPARGLTPCSWDLVKAGFRRPNAASSVHVLALGAQQKACLAWSDGKRITLGPYIGDLTSVSMQEAAIGQWRHLQRLYRFEHQLVTHDLHPDFFTTGWAMELAAGTRVDCFAVQHHRAHWLASLLEPGWLDREVIGMVWDGTGFGEDGSVWGGECFVGNRLSHERVASLLPFLLPGGEAAIREPWRVAVSLLCHVRPEFATEHFVGMPVCGITQMITDKLNVVPTSSMGRLFDAVATIILEPSIGRRPVAYEGELAQLLEERCDFSDVERYELSLIENGGNGLQGMRYWDWRPMIARIVQEKKAGVAIGKMAMRFHRGLVAAILELTKIYPDLPLTVSGGCWQNRVLVQLLQESEIEKERSVGWPGSVPVNDSGIAIGQTLAALSWYDTISQIDGGLGVVQRCV